MCTLSVARIEFIGLAGYASANQRGFADLAMIDHDYQAARSAWLRHLAESIVVFTDLSVNHHFGSKLRNCCGRETSKAAEIPIGLALLRCWIGRRLLPFGEIVQPIPATAIRLT